MALTNALNLNLPAWVRPGWLAIAAVLLLAPGAAQAMPIQVGENDDTDCLTRQTVDGRAVHDPVNGNFWARHDTFTIIGGDSCFSASFDGLSIVVKTPFQLDGPDDIDGFAEYAVLDAELEGLYPNFHENFGANFGMDTGANDPPLIGPEGAFESVFACVDAASIDDCLNNGPLIELFDVGGGFMVFSIGGLQSRFICDPGECTNNFSFTITSIVHSNIFDAPGAPPLDQVPIPEMMIGWRFTQVVPEPSLLALLAPMLGAVALRRRR